MVVRVFVLGIDPGLTRCGYCCIEVRGRETRAVDIGVLTTPPGDPVPERLAAIQLGVRGLLVKHRPEAVAVERVLFQVNVSTAMAVGQASGVVMAEAIQHGASVAEYSPNQVKETVAGWGAAPKAQIQQMVQMLLGLDAPPRPADAADAAAVALCHAAMAPMAAGVAVLAGTSRSGAEGQARPSRGSGAASHERRPGAGAVGGGSVRNRVRRAAAPPAGSAGGSKGRSS